MKKDGRIHRIWYLPSKWSEIKNNLGDVTNWSEYVSDGENTTDSDWDKSGWKLLQQFPYIFLSRSPLTFGHSQLVIPSPPARKWKKTKEEDFFEWSSHIIEGAIATFSRVFRDDKIHQHNKIFKNLAEVTQTKGRYIKTLILRASANEKVFEEYKVHLVPYFKSHATKCQDRFRCRHRASLTKTGGLLGWLGEREDEVDKWEADPTPCKYRLDDIANEDLKMSELARKLRDSWPEKNKKSP